MSNDSVENRIAKNATQALPPWSECDFFCIHDYAATGKSPCGWRGRLREVRRDETETKLLCPRCGYATVLRIPPAAAQH